MNDSLVKALFQTEAIEVCNEKDPFWYASGHIGPYYVNTHYLLGSKKAAETLLDTINQLLEGDRINCINTLMECYKSAYNSNNIYRLTIDSLVDSAKKLIDANKCDLISGGERRDWYFSVMTAQILNIPHVYIFKNGDMFLYHKEEISSIESLNNAKVLHMADIITQASSYLTQWIPAITKAGGKIVTSLTVVDRLQGGAENLSKHDIASHSLVNIDRSLFSQAKDNNVITYEQYEILNNYIENPYESMREFLIKNPDFIQKSIKMGGKTEQRAKMNIYNL